jgi:hypothetical protein
MADPVGGPARYEKFRAVGVLFYAFVAGAACLAVTGMSMVAVTHAPIWAIIFFASLLAISVPLGGVVSYVFFARRGATEIFDHRS